MNEKRKADEYGDGAPYEAIESRLRRARAWAEENGTSGALIELELLGHLAHEIARRAGAIVHELRTDNVHWAKISERTGVSVTRLHRSHAERGPVYLKNVYNGPIPTIPERSAL